MCWEAKEAITWFCTSPEKPYLGVPHTHTVEAGGIVRCTVNARCSLPHKTPSAALVASWKEMYCPLHRNRYPPEVVMKEDGGFPDLL